jgi:CRP-like cAMP-binding protein
VARKSKAKSKATATTTRAKKSRSKPSGALAGLKSGMLKRRSFRAGEVLFREDDPAECAYVIVSGAVSLSRLSRGGEDRPFLTLRAEEIVGEMGLIVDLKRSATATAREDTETVVIGRDEFLSHIARLNPFIHRVLTVLVTRLKTTTDAYMEF